MSAVKKYLSLIKFSHTIFAMPFALIGFMLAAAGYLKDLFLSWYGQNPNEGWVYSSNGAPADPWAGYKHLGLTFILVILCMVFARSAAMAFNRYLDRHFDAQNPRTAIREIPAGILKANNVLWFTIICSALFWRCFFFSPISIIAWEASLEV